MEDQRRDGYLLEILGHIRLRECLDAEIARRKARPHALQPERFAHAFGDLRARPVVAVERQREVLEEL